MSTDDATLMRFLDRLAVDPRELNNQFPTLYSNLSVVLTALGELRTLRAESKKKDEIIAQLQASGSPVTQIPEVPPHLLSKWEVYFEKMQEIHSNRRFKGRNWINVRLDFVRCFISRDNEWLDKYDFTSFFDYTEDAFLIKFKKYHDEGWLERRVPDEYHEPYRYRLNIEKTNFQMDL